MAQLDEWKAELAVVNEQIKELLANGQSVSVQGSHSYTKVRLAELKVERTRLLRLIAYASGMSSRKTEVPRYE